MKKYIVRDKKKEIIGIMFFLADGTAEFMGEKNAGKKIVVPRERAAELLRQIEEQKGGYIEIDEKD